MDGKLSRRNLVKSAAVGASGIAWGQVAGLDKLNDVAAAASTDSAAESASNAAIVLLTSTSDVFGPPHGGGMFGTNTANREPQEVSKFSDATTSQIDGDAFNLNWVDWDNDRHSEAGPLSEFRRGVLAKLAARAHRGDHRDLSRRRVFSGYRGGWENNTKADMYEGTKLLVNGLQQNFQESWRAAKCLTMLSCRSSRSSTSFRERLPARVQEVLPCVSAPEFARARPRKQRRE